MLDDGGVGGLARVALDKPQAEGFLPGGLGHDEQEGGHGAREDGLGAPRRRARGRRRGKGESETIHRRDRKQRPKAEPLANAHVPALPKHLRFPARVRGARVVSGHWAVASAYRQPDSHSCQPAFRSSFSLSLAMGRVLLKVCDAYMNYTQECNSYLPRLSF